MKIQSLLLATLFVRAAFCGEASTKQWENMDYGPFLSLTLNMGVKGNGSDNPVLKATVIKLGDKEHPAYIAYDTDTMRVAAVWTGGFIDWNGTIFNGNHHAQPKPKGTILHSTKNTPGWAKDRDFTDTRVDKRGPLPKEWLQYKGLYRSGKQVALSYTVNGCDVMEVPSIGYDAKNGMIVLTRTIEMGPSENPATVLVAEDETDKVLSLLVPNPKIKTQLDIGAIVVNHTPKWTESINSYDLPVGFEWTNAFGRAALFIPKRELHTTFSIRHEFKVESAMSSDLARPEHIDPMAFKEGGPALWPATVETQGSLGKEDGPYVVDTLSLPEKNPWHSWMRIGGFDFFADGKRAALCTWSGDVWIVSGIDDTLGKLIWKRFASGLYQPLGLKIVDDMIYCTCRDQIVKLHDFNNDGEADFYECFNNDFILSYHFHEFMMDLQTDADGNFYFAKSGTPGVGGPNFDIVTPHNGCFFKLSRDGKYLDIVARGLRAPNGIGVGPHGELTSGDNEGSWVPVCPINDVKQGGFLGVVPESWPGKPVPDKRDPPICWIPWHVDNSAGCQVWVTSTKWGPFENEMLHLSYGKASLFHVLTERVHDVTQGGVAKFPLQFGSGINRARFNSIDGQLYLTGLKGWQTTASHDGTFQRVRYNGKPVNLPAALHVTPSGVALTFTAPLDKETAEDVGNYAAWWFNVVWRKEYGSDRWSPTDPKLKWPKSATNPPGETIVIKSAKLSADGKTVDLEVPGLKPVTNMIIDMKIKAADGSKINQEICNTIHFLP